MLGLGKEVGSSLVMPSGNQLLLFENLRHLCGTHRSLLTIFHVARDDIAHVEGPYLLTERVSTIEEHFKRKLATLRSSMDTSLTIEIWWKHIEKEFQCIFRDVIQGLIHLYLNCGRGCGHIAFNTFLTDNGEAHILPSMDDIEKGSYSSKDVEDEAIELISLIKHVIIFPFVDDLTLTKTEDAKLKVYLPSELVHFFSFTCKYKPGVPPSFWLDHPYFWSVPDRINFAYKLNRISKRDNWKNSPFVTCLRTVTKGSYENCWDRLTGSYLEVCMKGEKQENEEDEEEEAIPQSRSGYYKVQPYKVEYDVIRFVGAVYTHINDLEYRKSQGRDRLADTDIEADLGNFFPDYYTVMFEIVCCCVASRSIDVEILKEISSFPFGSNVFRRTSHMQYSVGLGGVAGGRQMASRGEHQS